MKRFSRDAFNWWMAFVITTCFILHTLISQRILVPPGLTPASTLTWLFWIKFGMWLALVIILSRTMYRRYFLHRMRARIAERDNPVQPWRPDPPAPGFIPGRFRRTRAQAQRRRDRRRSWKQFVAHG